MPAYKTLPLISSKPSLLLAMVRRNVVQPAPGHPSTRHISPGLSAPEDLHPESQYIVALRGHIKQTPTDLWRIVFVSRCLFRPTSLENNVQSAKRGPMKK